MNLKEKIKELGITYEDEIRIIFDYGDEGELVLDITLDELFNEHDEFIRSKVIDHGKLDPSEGVGYWFLID